MKQVDQIEPEIIYKCECGDCYYNNLTCPCVNEDKQAIFHIEDGGILTGEEALKMLDNTETFSTKQKTLIAMCKYAIKHCYPELI